MLAAYAINSFIPCLGSIYISVDISIDFSSNSESFTVSTSFDVLDTFLVVSSFILLPTKSPVVYAIF